MKILNVVSGNWLDPWGIAHAVRNVKRIREVTLTEDTVPHDYGYPGYRDVPCRVYVDSLGRRYVAIPPMDFGGHTIITEIDPATQKDARTFWYESVALPAIRKGKPCDRQGNKICT